MEDYSRQRHEVGGYEFVYTPHLTKAQLFETSGHLSWYAEGMYPPMEMDNGTYYLKPMNCPMHCLVYRSRQRSYRELPLRLFELGTVYRYERAGTLHGLLRIRGFTQDDSHIYCTEEQLPEEIGFLLDFVLSVLRAFGFADFTFNLSTKDPNKYVGSDEIWDKATAALRDVLDARGFEYAIKDGDAAFYGPKIDIDVRDAIGRSWQLSTIQCDFNHPERFELEYVGADNTRHRPIMIHRALFGSIERFFGVLVEHYAGAFPTWLAPVQVRVLPVSTAHEEYAEKVADRIRSAGGRVDVVGAIDPLGKRIRAAKLEKLPYVLVVGDDDVAAGTVGVNPRGGSRRTWRRGGDVRRPLRRRGRAGDQPRAQGIAVIHPSASVPEWRARRGPAALGRALASDHGAGHQVECVPLEIRSGSRTLAIGPSAIAAASSTRHSEQSRFMSVVNVTTYPSSSAIDPSRGAIGASLPNTPSPNRYCSVLPVVTSVRISPSNRNAPGIAVVEYTYR